MISPVEKDPVRDGFLEWARALGMSGRGGTFYLKGGEVLRIANLQRSAHGPSYYVNIGFSLLTDEEESSFPKDSQADVRLRLSNVLEEGSLSEKEVEGVTALFSTETPIANQAAHVAAVLETWLTPIVRQSSTIEGLKSLIKEHPAFSYALIQLRVRSALQ